MASRRRAIPLAKRAGRPSHAPMSDNHSMERLFGRSAALWDMDGTLLDTERLSLEAWKEAVRQLGGEVSEEVFLSIIGMTRPHFEMVLEDALGRSIDVPALIELTNEIYQERVAKGVPLKPGARRCLDLLRARGVPQALATSSSMPTVLKKLGAHGLVDRFAALLTGDQVARSKPDPEIYLRAAAALGLRAEECLVFEDSRHGVVAASRAGAFTALVPDLVVHERDTLDLVVARVESLEEVADLLESGL